MYYLQSRYYSPDWGRFINADAIAGHVGELLGHNLFAYCKNNPINNFDPSGFRTLKNDFSDPDDEHEDNIQGANITKANGVTLTEKTESHVYDAPGGKVSTVTNYSTIHFENSVAGEQAAEALNAKMSKDAAYQEWFISTLAGFGSLKLEGKLAKSACATLAGISLIEINLDFSFSVHAGDTIKITTYGAGGGGPTRNGLSQTIEIFRSDGTVDTRW